MISKPLAALVVLLVLIAGAIMGVTWWKNRSAASRTAGTSQPVLPGRDPARELTTLMLREANGMTIKSEEILPALHNSGPEYRRTFVEPIVAIGQQKVISENGEGIVTIFLFENRESAGKAMANAASKVAKTNRLHQVDRAVIRLAGKAPTMVEVTRQIGAMQARFAPKGK
jgi:hypothetical protein